jgi:hypothetical protein
MPNEAQIEGTQKCLANIYYLMSSDLLENDEATFNPSNNFKTTIDDVFNQEMKHPFSSEILDGGHPRWKITIDEIYYRLNTLNSDLRIDSEYINEFNLGTSEENDVTNYKKNIWYTLYQLINYDFFKNICFYQTGNSDREEENQRYHYPNENQIKVLAKMFKFFFNDLQEKWESNQPKNSYFFKFHDECFNYIQPPPPLFLVNPDKTREGIDDGLERRKFINKIKDFLVTNQIIKREEKHHIDGKVCVSLYFLFHLELNKPICPYPIPENARCFRDRSYG